MRSNFATTTATILGSLLATSRHASAHMQLSWPPPLLSTYNPYTASGSADYSYTSPLNADGTDFPCKGHLTALNTAEGKSVATFAAGGQYNYTVVGGAYHNGGSCQASLSYDGGKTYTVINSYVGNCPLQTTGNFDFTVPSDAQTGAALFTWTWFNNEGNREMYMNCASVTIGAASASKKSKRHGADDDDDEREIDTRDVAFAQRPQIFVANIGNGCTTVGETDLIFPDPGEDVVTSSVAGHTFASATGNCAAATGAAAAVSTSSPNTNAGVTTSSAAAMATSPVSSSIVAAATTSGTTSSAASPTASTLSTATVSSGSSSGSGMSGGNNASGTATTPSTSPTTSPGSSSSSSGSGSGSSSSGSASYASGTACSDEGAWNCVGGTSFQRCASGMWSALQPMAAGTSCQPGVSDTLVLTKRSAVLGRKRSAAGNNGAAAAPYGIWTGRGAVVRRGRLVRD